MKNHLQKCDFGMENFDFEKEGNFVTPEKWEPWNLHISLSCCALADKC